MDNYDLKILCIINIFIILFKLNTRILIINCPKYGFIETQRNYNYLKYRIIAGEANKNSIK